MAVERKFYVGRILAAILISAIIYVGIFSFAHWISYKNYSGISERNLLVQESLDELESALENVSCNESVLVSVSEKLDQIGASLGLLEMRLGKNEPRVLEQKKLYSELEKRHFELIKEMNKRCNSSFVTVLFFYSNDKNAQKRSDIAGAILTTLKRSEPERVMIYSFDYNLDTLAIDELKQKYLVATTPFVLVDEKHLIVNLKNIQQLEPYLLIDE